MKNKTLLFVKNAVPVILFNIIFFITWGFNSPASVWVSYGLIHFSYGLLVISSIFNKKSDKNGSFSFTNKLISLIYCILEFVAGLIFIILRLETVNISLYIQLPLLAIYTVVIVYNIFFNDKTEENTVGRQKELNYIKNCVLMIENILTQNIEENTRKKLMKAKELIQTSPSKSNEQSKPFEEKVMYLLTQINEKVFDSIEIENLATQLIKYIKLRNISIKTSN